MRRHRTVPGASAGAPTKQDRDAQSRYAEGRVLTDICSENSLIVTR
jgi:hypothetical protein